MLSQTLVEQLKEAGFPQNIGKYDSGFTTDKGVYIPTLSELIEACGTDNLDVVVFMEGKQHVGKFGYGPDGWGKELDEAVANLYLALKQ